MNSKLMNFFIYMLLFLVKRIKKVEKHQILTIAVMYLLRIDCS